MGLTFCVVATNVDASGPIISTFKLQSFRKKIADKFR